MGHHCHARGCTVEVPPRMLMCRRHWRMVPRELQRAVWREYVTGQEIRKDPTVEYLDAADAVIEAVFEHERQAVLERAGQLTIGDLLGRTSEVHDADT